PLRAKRAFPPPARRRELCPATGSKTLKDDGLSPVKILQFRDLQLGKPGSSAPFRGATSSIRQLPSPFGAKRQEGGRCGSEVFARKPALPRMEVIKENGA